MTHRLTCQTVLIIFILFCSVSVTVAGNIDVNNDGHKYAWGENIGWISFSCGNTDYCTEGINYGVYIDPQTGILAGKAWAENVGSDCF